MMFDFVHAQRLCAAEGKRVCTETEWTMACEGPDTSRTPTATCATRRSATATGRTRAGRHAATTRRAGPSGVRLEGPGCREPEIERLWQGVESGSQPQMRERLRRLGHAGQCRRASLERDRRSRSSKYDNVTTGGPWLYGVRNQCRPKIYTHNEGFEYYYLSTRCCAEADGAPTDPRSPKQIKRGVKWRP